MGDKAKLNQTGHLPLIYDPDLRELGELVQLYEDANLSAYLNLANKGNPDTTNDVVALKARIRELEAKLLTERLQTP